MYNFFNVRFFTDLKPKTYRLKPNKGFTLIELLVVVGIIGLLSTVVLATLSGTRPRARDAKRLSDVKQMALVLIIESTTVAGSQALDGCETADALTSTCGGPGDVREFPSFTDPSGSESACAGASGVCAYSISNKLGTGRAATGDYQICFWLEDPVAAGRTGNLNRVVSPAGNIETGCL